MVWLNLVTLQWQTELPRSWDRRVSGYM